MDFESEKELETFVRRLIAEEISPRHRHIYALKNKKAVDIVICRDGENPALFFLEVKYHRLSHGRLGFGDQKGGGHQPEIVSKGPKHFESHLRWIMGSDHHAEKCLIFTDTATIRSFLAGGEIGKKQYNIQEKIFREFEGLSEKQFAQELESWLVNT